MLTRCENGVGVNGLPQLHRLLTSLFIQCRRRESTQSLDIFPPALNDLFLSFSRCGYTRLPDILIGPEMSQKGLGER